MTNLLADKLRSPQLDALSIDDEVTEMAADQAMSIVDVYGVTAKWRDTIRVLVRVIVSLLAVVKSPNQTIGMSMLQLKLKGSNIKGFLYTIGRALEHYVSEMDPLSRKVIDIFNTACFLVFLCPGRYPVWCYNQH